MKKILIHSIAFSPDGVSTAYLYNDIAIRFKEEGWNVVVLSTTPHFNAIEEQTKLQPLKRKLFGLYYVSAYNGIVVKHIFQKKYKNTVLRLLGFVYWHIMSFFMGVFEKKIDVIISPSPPLSIGVINIMLGKIKRAKVIYNIQEIYPDLLIQTGALKSKCIISILKYLERFVYNKSDALTTIDEVFYKTIFPRVKDQYKLTIIPNFVDTNIYKPINTTNTIINESYFPKSNSLKLMYAGNIGKAQEWRLLIDLAIELKEYPIEFYIIGEGVEKNQLISEIKKNQLEKIHIIPYQPRESMPSLIAFSDIQFIFMTRKTDMQGFPSKVYTIMACAKPIIVYSGELSPIVKFLQDKDCAFISSSEDYAQNVIEIKNFLINCSKDKLIEMGLNGKEVIEKNYSKEVVTNKYVDLINGL